MIVDMSHPHLDKAEIEVFGTRPISCNASIDKACYPAKMSSNRDVLEMILRHGKGFFVSKQDWSGRRFMKLE